MQRVLRSCFFFFLVLLSGLLLFSCKDTKDVPFPDSLGNQQPITTPLTLTESKPLHWDTIGKATLTPTVFPVDFEKMNSRPYDSSGFEPLPTPTEVTFKLSSLSSIPFDTALVPSVSLNLKMEVMSPSHRADKVRNPVKITATDIDLW